MTTAGLHDSPAAAPAPAGDRAPTAAGLTSGEAAARLRRLGPNELPEPERHPVRDFLRYFWGPIPGMIEAAAVLSAAVRHWPEFGIIVVLLLANAVVGFWEEFQAGNALEALRSRLAPRARVRRDGVWTVVPARELVPGDVVRLRLGDIAPADAIVRGDDVLEVDQSALTGESLPVPVGRDGDGARRRHHPPGRGRRRGHRPRARTPSSAAPRAWWKRNATTATSSGRCCASATSWW